MIHFAKRINEAILEAKGYGVIYKTTDAIYYYHPDKMVSVILNKKTGRARAVKNHFNTPRKTYRWGS